MGTRKRPEGTAPWMPGFRYGALLPALSLNLLVRHLGPHALTKLRDLRLGEAASAAPENQHRDRSPNEQAD